MKAHTLLVAGLLLNVTLHAKQVKFSVDMTGQTISPNGVHVVGDFQAAAGLGPDWDPSTAPLTKEGNTNIYSLVVSVPAFKKYEYRFVNGDQTYESEFVPDLSRVGYNLVDNRWIFVDSTSTAVMDIGAITFGGNAPTGKLLVRYKVNMGLEVISGNGTHLGTSYQSNPFDASGNLLYSFEPNVYEIINYVSAGTYSYNFFNGNTTAASEIVVGTCAPNGKRSFTIYNDTTFETICFSSCAACVGVGLKEVASNNDLKIYPNPATNEVTVSTVDEPVYAIYLSDYTGKIFIELDGAGTKDRVIDIRSLNPGIYFLSIRNKQGVTHTSKLLVN